MSRALELAAFLAGLRSPRCGEAAAELRRLDAEVEALRKDAARYRWLRNHKPANTEDPGWLDLGELDLIFVGTGAGTASSIDGPDLDAAIDAARGAK